ncbi:MAG: hypothetical protein EOS58_05780 [Mesorhizobium sp.]|uniref:hypothetical protein n=1 Tax=unclassified Mesorhizobium TaxID=325217 RepID=UPI000F7651E1|nr:MULTISPECIES: hypothetical protein [unclassified Mesorhizobium]AZO47327.1 hypothetical protein EJ073_05380 [Mesorhizobium sp. M4B.F.Ca.ET.058.02.1.1]RVC33566.1 hypothetical protein EN781_33555 [Mesorhizobium sp. M4A.F.Ca.ET.090.04.2.1]RWC55750.1 MAG: hypothetical protein EOS54_07840 [Mesorhizobium sp.]RWD06522.1 MAG: hypothetical protein EOS58_05780 [Mesorhizobium sp.]RWD14068.1 MAG: hypothetical protein EOS74_18960 [Mesorhizobium sp.]
MYAIKSTHVDPTEVQRLVKEISELIANADSLLSAREVQQKLDSEGSHEAIAKALRVAIERGDVEILDNMKLQVSNRGDLPIAEVAQ